MKNVKAKEDKTINDTKIKYIKILDKLYEVEKISFYNFTAEAYETELLPGDVPEPEVWDITDLKEFKVRLKNCGCKVIDLAEWKIKHGLDM